VRECSICCRKTKEEDGKEEIMQHSISITYTCMLSAENNISTDEVITAVKSLPGVREFEYQPEKKFLHVTGNRNFLQPFDVVRRIEELGISSDGLFVYYPSSF